MFYNNTPLFFNFIEYFLLRIIIIFYYELRLVIILCLIQFRIILIKIK